MNLNDPFSLILTKNKQVQIRIELAKKFSKLDAPILISGETGTGKDIWAKACHLTSSRAQFRFLALNCAGLPDEVIETELFGLVFHQQGKKEIKKGFFEQADKGSVLLDQIDEMSPSLQAKLLRFLQDGSFRRVGDDEPQKVDIRIIGVTQKNLAELVKEKKFREDLFYRLNVLPLDLLPLRNRKEDILLLAVLFLNEQAKKMRIKMPKLTENAQKKLIEFNWPGNIRQLKNVLFFSCSKQTSGEITDKDIILPNDDIIELSEVQRIFLLSDLEKFSSLAEMNAFFEQRLLETLYENYPSSRKLAKRLNVSHTTIANKLREYNITKEK